MGRESGLVRDFFGLASLGLFFSTLCRASSSGAPSAALEAAIRRDYDSIEALQVAISTAANRRFGSGWVWLAVNATGALRVVDTPNQDNPLMELDPGTQRPTSIPFLGLDVWEHSYYLRYQNRRGDYVKEWWKVVDWGRVSHYYERFASQQLAVEWWGTGE